MSKQISLLIALLFCVAVSASAQKFGYLNSTSLLAELPEVKEADNLLKAFQTQLQNQGQKMVKDLQDRAADLQRRKDKGLISPKEEEEMGKKLQEEENKIREFEQKMYDDIAKRRESLYSPILQKVDGAMKAVATENNFVYVFDNSQNILLYVDPSLDVTALVKAKMAASK